MIRSLRFRHRVTVCALGIALPAAFTVGMAARKPIPTMSSLALETKPTFNSLLWERSDLWSKPPITTRLFADANNALAISLLPPADFTKPDVLVYWLDERAKPGDSLPQNALLLGGLTSTVPLPISGLIRKQSGVLLLYSLADQEVLAVSKPFGAQNP
jgi:hypothetical protein